MNTKLLHIFLTILLYFAFIAATYAATNSASTNSADCDLIVLKTGEEISAKVVKISSNEIEYKNCGNIDGPLHTVKTQDVLRTSVLPKNQGTGTNAWAVWAFVFSIFCLIPYLNTIALGGYLPALFYRMGKKKMAENADLKANNLLKSAKVMTIIGFSISAITSVGALIALIIGGIPLGILLLLGIVSIWGLFKILE